jgi:hypothetical protein
VVVAILVTVVGAAGLWATATMDPRSQRRMRQNPVLLASAAGYLPYPLGRILLGLLSLAIFAVGLIATVAMALS